jgi:hypothetical protein
LSVSISPREVEVLANWRSERWTGIIKWLESGLAGTVGSLLLGVALAKGD